MAAPPFGFQQQLNPDLLNQVAHSGDNTGWGPIVKQLLGAVQQGVAQSQQKQRSQQFQQMISQLMGPQQQQQGPQMPTGPAIKGPQGYVPPGAGPMAVPAGQSPMPTNPSSGMGAAPPPFNGVDPGKLIGLYMQMDPQGANALIGKMLGGKMAPPQMNPLQQAQAALDYARAKALSQPKPTPTAGKGIGWRVIQGKDGAMYKYNEQTGESIPLRGPTPPPPPKPVKPDFTPDKMDLQAQIANQKIPWYDFWHKPVKSPLSKQSGLTPQEQADYDQLHKKFGGQQ